VKLHEDETTELKKSTSELKEAVISIAAILNKHQKGEIYFGVLKNGKVAGQQVTEKTIRDVSQAISNHIEPRIFPKIVRLKQEGKSCIHVSFEGAERPYFAYGRAYIRVGDEDKQLSAKELENLILKKNQEKMRWEVQVCERATYGDISRDKLKSFLRSSRLKFGNIGNALSKLNLASAGKPLNAAIILFGRKPERFFPSARLRCATFGTDNTSAIIDMKDFEGDLFSLIKKAEEYILSHINIGMRLDGLRRVDVPEIDREAVREAIINAFCHRDYSEYDSVNIAVFRDRVEIRSPGGLFGGLTIEQITKENVSRRRNELIADIFHRVHFVEKWGRGIELILTKEPTAAFKEIAGTFVTVLHRKEARKKTSEETTHELPINYSKTTHEAFAIIIEVPTITREELAERLGLSPDGAKYHLDKLRKGGHIRRVGGRKGGHWEAVI
jgi:ATP-dependent DNA helicase RecG